MPYHTTDSRINSTGSQSVTVLYMQSCGSMDSFLINLLKLGTYYPCPWAVHTGVILDIHVHRPWTGVILGEYGTCGQWTSVMAIGDIGIWG